MEATLKVRHIVAAILLALTTLLASAAAPVGNGGGGGALPCDELTVTCVGGTVQFINPIAGVINQQFNAAGACATGASTAEACFDGTSTIGLVIGPTGGYTAGSTGSQQLCLERTVSGVTSCATATYGTGGTLTFTAASGFNFGTGTMLYGQDIMGATCALSAAGTMPAGSHACKLTFALGITSMVITYASAYGTQAICETNDETTANGSRATVCGPASATVTATTNDVVDFTVTGK